MASREALNEFEQVFGLRILPVVVVVFFPGGVAEELASRAVCGRRLKRCPVGFNCVVSVNAVESGSVLKRYKELWLVVWDHLTSACTRQALLSRLVLAHKPRQTGEAPAALAGETNVIHRIRPMLGQVGTFQK